MYQIITQKEAKRLMDTEQNYIILDVRRQDEYEAGHIPRAVLLDLEEVEDRAEDVLPSQEQLILVYCRSGRRSKMASEILCDLGYNHVKEFGGILDWPYEVITGTTSICTKEGNRTITLRQATMADASTAVDILHSARDFQREQGFVQWPDGYPDHTDVQNDIEEGNGYVLLVDEQIAGYMYIGFDGDPAYPQVKGAWHSDLPYAVVHRMGIGGDFRGKGLADKAFSLVAHFCLDRGIFNLRIDTDEANKRMQHILKKNGFSYCGTVIQGNGDRMAFDKILH